MYAYFTCTQDALKTSLPPAWHLDALDLSVFSRSSCAVRDSDLNFEMGGATPRARCQWIEPSGSGWGLR
ncbi:hypothetical protein QCA50_010282 [Cerrena zonata]|uniref:Uncharacterized protein n=1 Tax=Cerrena zonata TaxID=2478898 RepID=A0AAW0G9W1_9APHY